MKLEDKQRFQEKINMVGKDKIKLQIGTEEVKRKAEVYIQMIISKLMCKRSANAKRTDEANLEPVPKASTGQSQNPYMKQCEMWSRVGKSHAPKKHIKQPVAINAS